MTNVCDFWIQFLSQHKMSIYFKYHRFEVYLQATLLKLVAHKTSVSCSETKANCRLGTSRRGRRVLRPDVAAWSCKQHWLTSRNVSQQERLDVQLGDAVGAGGGGLGAPPPT